MSRTPSALKITGITPDLPGSTRRSQFVAATQPQEEITSRSSSGWSPVLVKLKKLVRILPCSTRPKSWIGSANSILGPELVAGATTGDWAVAAGAAAG